MQRISEEHDFRAKSLAHFDHETDFQELQKFQTLKTRVSPRIHDDRLDWLLNRSSKASAAWLINDSIFQGWLDTSNPTVRLLWLQGIPGAGKLTLSLNSTGLLETHIELQARPFFPQPPSTRPRHTTERYLCL